MADGQVGRGQLVFQRKQSLRRGWVWLLRSFKLRSLRVVRRRLRGCTFALIVDILHVIDELAD